MNKELGFGIVAGGLVAGVVVAPAPAGAHEVAITSSQGSVKVSSLHTTIYANNTDCDDGLNIAAEYWTWDGIHWLLSDRNCGTTPTSRSHPAGISQFRKCQYTDNIDNRVCGDWLEVT